MKLIFFGVFLFFLFCPLSLAACEPPIYLKFHEDARYHLDSMSQFATNNSLLDSIVLMHNLAFHRDEKMREQAEKLLKENFKKEKRTPLVEAYDGSLQMIKVSHRGKGSKIFRSIFGKSPYDEAREGFKMISQALVKDPGNFNIRFIRATAAVEAVEYLPELFPYANEDIQWLEKHIDYSNPALVFFLNLTWAKYYYKFALTIEPTNIRSTIVKKASGYIDLAGEYICNEVYCREYELWRQRIDSLLIE